MKQALFSILYLVCPNLLVFAFSLLLLYNKTSFGSIAVLYFLSIVGVICFFKYKVCNFTFMIVGFAISPLLVFLYEHWLNSEFFTHLYSGQSFVYYAIPLVIFSFFAYLANSLRKPKQ